MDTTLAKPFRWMVVMACVAVLLACATPSVPTTYRLETDPQQGLVVGSITYEGSMGQRVIDATSRNGVDRFHASSGFNLWPPLGPEYHDGLKQRGGLFAVAVPAGEYTLQRWSVNRGARQTIAKNPLEIGFKVAAGKVTYLGSFHFDEEDAVSLTDLRARDLPLLQAQFAAVAGMQIPAYAIAPGTRLIKMGDSPMSAPSHPIYNPVPAPFH